MKHIYSFAAQIIASMTSVVVTVFAARTLSPDEVGVVALVMSTQIIVLGLVRSFGADPLLYAHSSYSGHPRVNESTTFVVSVAVVVSLIVGIGAGALVGLAGGAAVFAVTWTTVVQDHLRAMLIVTRRNEWALVSDTVAFVALCTALVFGPKNVEGILFMWSASALIGILPGWAVITPRMRLREGLAWARSARRDGAVLAVDFSVTNGLSQVSVFVVAVTVGGVGAAALRAAQVLNAPVMMVLRAATTAVVPLVIGRAASGRLNAARQICVGFAAVSVAAATMSLVWLLVPLGWVQLLLGETAPYALAVLGASALVQGLMGVASGAGFYLRGTGRIRLATRLKLVVAPVSLGGVVAGSLIGGAAGSQLGMASGELIRAVGAWFAVLRRAN